MDARRINRFWPRAKSKLYEEPKKLVAHGLAQRGVARRTGQPTADGLRDHGGGPAGHCAEWLGVRRRSEPVVEFDARR